MPSTADFPALLVRKSDGSVTAAVERIAESDLPPGEVTVAVAYSTLNYKDGLAIQGLGNIVKSFPHVPGIDFAGTVERSASPDFKPGDKVVLTGWKASESRWGGYAAKARVPAAWLIPLVEPFTLSQAMAIGTAGFSAMLALMALESRGLAPHTGNEVLVTGASGGVGAIAVALLSANGYRVAAATGRAEAHDFLKGLGAATIVPREDLDMPPRRPLAPERWAGAIDNVGGNILANVLAALKSGASCASVGLAASAKLETTVLPFILRGVALLGVDSGNTPMAVRRAAWARLAAELPRDKLDAASTQAPLGDVLRLAGEILAGRIRGRLVIDVNA